MRPKIGVCWFLFRSKKKGGELLCDKV